MVFNEDCIVLNCGPERVNTNRISVTTSRSGAHSNSIPSNFRIVDPNAACATSVTVTSSQQGNLVVSNLCKLVARVVPNTCICCDVTIRYRECPYCDYVVVHLRIGGVLEVDSLVTEFLQLVVLNVDVVALRSMNGIPNTVVVSPNHVAVNA